MKSGLVQEKVEQRGVIRLDDEEEEFFGRDPKESGPGNGVRWVRPYSVPDEVRIPGAFVTVNTVPV